MYAIGLVYYGSPVLLIDDFRNPNLGGVKIGLPSSTYDINTYASRNKSKENKVTLCTKRASDCGSELGGGGSITTAPTARIPCSKTIPGAAGSQTTYVRVGGDKFINRTKATLQSGSVQHDRSQRDARNITYSCHIEWFVLHKSI